MRCIFHLLLERAGHVTVLQLPEQQSLSHYPPNVLCLMIACWALGKFLIVGVKIVNYYDSLCSHESHP